MRVLMLTIFITFLMIPHGYCIGSITGSCHCDAGHQVIQSGENDMHNTSGEMCCSKNLFNTETLFDTGCSCDGNDNNELPYAVPDVEQDDHITVLCTIESCLLTNAILQNYLYAFRDISAISLRPSTDIFSSAFLI